MLHNLPRLYYLSSNNKPEPLPEWAYFFMQLGYQLATTPNGNYRLVIGLAIPTRAFACSLVAIGVVFAGASNENSIDAVQLHHIRGLKPGTPVYVHTDNKRLRGIVTKFVNFKGKQYISIRTTQTMERSFPVDAYASRITIAERDVNLPKHQQSGYSVETPSKFLQCCLGEELAQTYILDSSFEALLVGKKSVIKYEVSGIFFSCKKSDKFPGVIGCLQEILRIRQFSGANKSYRTQCISSSNATSEKTGKQIPPIVIFDGTAAYINLGHKWRSAHQIVLLDRTERQFAEAIELLNQNYAYRLGNGFEFPIKIPTGIEMMVYKESVQ